MFGVCPKDAAGRDQVHQPSRKSRKQHSARGSKPPSNLLQFDVNDVFRVDPTTYGNEEPSTSKVEKKESARGKDKLIPENSKQS